MDSSPKGAFSRTFHESGLYQGKAIRSDDPTGRLLLGLEIPDCGCPVFRRKHRCWGTDPNNPTCDPDDPSCLCCMGGCKCPYLKNHLCKRRLTGTGPCRFTSDDCPRCARQRRKDGSIKCTCCPCCSHRCSCSYSVLPPCQHVKAVLHNFGNDWWNDLLVDYDPEGCGEPPVPAPARAGQIRARGGMVALMAERALHKVGLRAPGDCHLGDVLLAFALMMRKTVDR